ncbi:MAG: hypothetical protein ACRER4_05750 [Steroidobacteraceae bacterium]
MKIQERIALHLRESPALLAGNACVTFHVKNGAFDGTCAQFYPTIRHRISKAMLEMSEAG